MKIFSWNVNGIRACMGKGFREFFKSQDPDIFCVQEAKMQEGQADISIDGYCCFLNSAQKKGYAGTILYSKKEPISVAFGIRGKHTDEGRVITAEYEDFYVVCSYSPNSQDELRRIAYRLEFEDDMRNYLVELNEKKPVIYTGDFNVANEPIDLKYPERNEGATGYSKEERGKFKELLGSGFFDAYRVLYPKLQEFTWWSYRQNARGEGNGWRIDYFVLSDRLKPFLMDCKIHTKTIGSDHAPIELDINIK